MMHMTFYWSKNVTILFSSWRTNSWLDYSISLLICFLISVFYQYMEDRRIKLKQISNSSNSAVRIPLLQSKFTGDKWSPARFAGSVLFGVNSAIGYMLMLAIMSFNGGVFVAIVVGLSVGYLLFRSDDGENNRVVDNPCACA